MVRFICGQIMGFDDVQLQAPELFDIGTRPHLCRCPSCLATDFSQYLDPGLNEEQFFLFSHEKIMIGKMLENYQGQAFLNFIQIL
jgi:hypothetical protein